MDRDKLYEEISARKATAQHLEEYHGGNGRIDKFLNLVRSGVLPKGGLVLDVGGSHGDLVQIALREGLFDDGCVLDISEYAVRTARDRGIWADMVDIDRDGMRHHPDSTASMVVALDFIEHIVDPENFVRESFRVLKPGGVLFINTPNISYWEHLDSLVVHGHFPHTSGDREVYHGGHLGFYNEIDMERMFMDAGFRELDVWPDPGVAPPPIWVQLSRVDSARKMRMLTSPNLLFFGKKP